MAEEMIHEEIVDNIDVDNANEVPEETPGQQHEHDGAEGEHADDGKAGREAAKYRRQLRDTEAERDTLRGQLDQARELLVQAAIGRKGVTVAALKAAGTDIAALFGDDGHVNRDAVNAAATEAAAKLGITPPRLHLPSEGKSVDGGGTGGTNFAAAFSPDPETRHSADSAQYADKITREIFGKS